MSDWFLDQLRPSTAATFGRSDQEWATLTGYVRGTAVERPRQRGAHVGGLMLLHVPLVPVIAVLTFFGGFFPIVGAFASGGVAAHGGPRDQRPRQALLVVRAHRSWSTTSRAIWSCRSSSGGPSASHTLVVLLALAAGGEIAACSAPSSPCP